MNGKELIFNIRVDAGDTNEFSSPTCDNQKKYALSG